MMTDTWPYRSCLLILLLFWFLNNWNNTRQNHLTLNMESQYVFVADFLQLRAMEEKKKKKMRNRKKENGLVCSCLFILFCSLSLSYSSALDFRLAGFEDLSTLAPSSSGGGRLKFLTHNSNFFKIMEIDIADGMQWTTNTIGKINDTIKKKERERE